MKSFRLKVQSYIYWYKKFIVGKFLDFKIINSRIMICQDQEFHLILHDIHSKVAFGYCLGIEGTKIMETKMCLVDETKINI